MTNTTKLTIACAVLTAAMPCVARAVPTALPLQGVLTDADGVPLMGDQVVRFRLYDAATGGTALHDETLTLPVDGGLFVAYLGTASVLSLALFDGGDVWLGMTVGADAEMTPRLPIGTVPYSARALMCGVADDAALFGGQPPSAYASAAHTHSGVYLPIGTSLTCPGTDKAVGLTPSGNVMCAPDEDTRYFALRNGGLNLAGGFFSIAPDGVTSAMIQDGAIATSDIAMGAIDSAAIADGSVSSADVADGSIASADIAMGAVDGAAIADGSVYSSDVADGSITRTDLAGPLLAVYRIAAGCAGQGNPALTLETICSTVACPSGSTYYTCAGSCLGGGTSPANCLNTRVGYLVP